MSGGSASFHYFITARCGEVLSFTRSDPAHQLDPANPNNPSSEWPALWTASPASTTKGCSDESGWSGSGGSPRVRQHPRPNEPVFRW
jgi:hypothetical protein